ncbi:MAG: hypothetical protein KatS3mg110_3946 [Pirellulaceae bacterium]|nr:MAG: hypothetical protein KatS3mg110_3946 [Pirellulaceae bacterium]
MPWNSRPGKVMGGANKMLDTRVAQLCQQLGCVPEKLAVILVDHGSRIAESNELLHQMAERFKAYTGLAHVEPAHMELAEPSIEAAYRRCVAAGAALILVAPFFLLPGKHWTEDIPRLVAEAARPFPHTTYRIAPPLGIDDLLVELLLRRLAQSV